MMETYYGIDDTGDLQDLWDNDFSVVSTERCLSIKVTPNEVTRYL